MGYYQRAKKLNYYNYEFEVVPFPSQFATFFVIWFSAIPPTPTPVVQRPAPETTGPTGPKIVDTAKSVTPATVTTLLACQALFNPMAFAIPSCVLCHSRATGARACAPMLGSCNVCDNEFIEIILFVSIL